jgi:Domain of unknown function (DUF1963)
MASRVSIKGLKTRLARRAALIEVGGFRPPAEPWASWFGRVNLALPGETWPVEGGRSMLPIAQLNLREAPFVPPALADLELIAVFFGRGALQAETSNGDGWLVRAYPRLDELAAIDVPDDVASGVSEMIAGGKPIRPFPIRYSVLEHDYPDWDDVADLDIPEAITDRWEDHFSAARGCKLGGWPSLIQSEVFSSTRDASGQKPEFVIQLDMVPKANFIFHADSTCYLGRGTGAEGDTWFFDWQCD